MGGLKYGDGVRLRRLHILLIGWGLAYCRTFRDEHGIFLGGRSSLLSTVFDRLEDSSVRASGCWSLFMGFKGVVFHCLLDCIGGVLGSILSAGYPMLCSSSSLYRRRYLFGGRWSHQLSSGQGLTNQIDGKLPGFSNASSDETGWKDRRIKSPLCARVGWVAYLAGVFCLVWSGLVFRFSFLLVACDFCLIAGIAIWGGRDGGFSAGMGSFFGIAVRAFSFLSLSLAGWMD